ncbi:unnamed protein product [Sphenostylis stenocarpa]|uniref:Uncharacterized protein n=1 Tax=Sphenostylis stenocarpa TaxID=92480 RepID=A0AA86SVH8_9FABA|nr:unnamed protein product [Sphenostylis stenocarpa]
MADPYYSYGAPAAAEGASIARTSFAGYIPSEPSNSTELRDIGSDYLQRDIGLFYSADDTLGPRVHSEPVKGYSPLSNPDLSKKRDKTPLGINHGVPDVNSERASSKSSYDGLPVSAVDSNILFVGGLPNNCTRREVGRILCGLYVSLYSLHIGYCSKHSNNR